MSARSYPLLALAILCATLLAATGCEDDIAVDDGIPTDAEFLAATQGAIALFPAAVNPSLGLLRQSANYELLGDMQRRLRAIIPSEIANRATADETASASYDSSAGEWTVTGSATSGDSLRYDYVARIAYFDTLGNRQADVQPGLTERGEVRESVSLTFVTGDFGALESYDVQLDAELFVEILVPLSASATADTFLVDVQADLSVRSKAAGVDEPIDAIDHAGRLWGRTGPRRNSTNCFRNSNALTAEWNGFEAIFQVESSGTVALGWFDPDDTIQGIQRILFEQRLPMECR